MKNKNLCYHILPYRGVVKPSKVLWCDCGKNTVCPICGFGKGSIPCNCDGVKKEGEDELET